MINKINKKYKIILASKSPRRQELLHDLGLKFTVQTRPTDESYPAGLQNRQIAEHIAYKKAEKFTPGENQLIITADTIVCYKNNVLGKPANRSEAVQMISNLSGNAHEVISGVCLKSKEFLITFHSETRVVFNDLTAEEIKFYVDRFKPFDKAGAYGIQEWIGMVAVKHIEGSYFNVIGLPVHQLYQQLKTIVKL